MPERKSPRDHVVRTSDLGGEDMRVSHPLEPLSEIFMTRLSDRTGLTHLGVSLARVPPGKVSFSLHVHSVQEEWIYVLSGRGHVRIDDEDVAIGPGDFVGFPPNGPAHLVRNTSQADLVYLQGGDRRQGDRGCFPSLGLVVWEHADGQMALAREDQIELRPFSDWIAEK